MNESSILSLTPQMAAMARVSQSEATGLEPPPDSHVGVGAQALGAHKQGEWLKVEQLAPPRILLIN